MVTYGPDKFIIKLFDQPRCEAGFSLYWLYQVRRRRQVKALLFLSKLPTSTCPSPNPVVPAKIEIDQQHVTRIIYFTSDSCSSTMAYFLPFSVSHPPQYIRHSLEKESLIQRFVNLIYMIYFQIFSYLHASEALRFREDNSLTEFDSIECHNKANTGSRTLRLMSNCLRLFVFFRLV